VFVSADGQVSTTVQEVSMQLPRVSIEMPAGLSFEIPDLLMIRGWADFHELRMAIELDVCTDGDEYEELLGLYDKDRVFRRWMFWRSRDGIVVQPMMGRRMLFDRMADALDILIPAGN
jgi:hypothetical protein